MVKTDTKIYRGRTLEEVLPKIKAELGPDAEIVRQRSGLAGGIGGVFPRGVGEGGGRAASWGRAAGGRGAATRLRGAASRYERPAARDALRGEARGGGHRSGGRPRADGRSDLARASVRLEARRQARRARRPRPPH